MSHGLIAISRAIIDRRIRDLGDVTSLALALLTVFTGQRWLALRERASDEGISKLEVLGGGAVDFVIFAATLGLAAVALPLVVSAIKTHNFTHSEGVVRSSFLIVWVLVVGLLIWQATILVRTCLQTKDLPWRRIQM